MIRQFKKLNTSNEELNRIQDAIASSFSQLANEELLGGVILENISLSSGVATTIAHKLFRKPSGYSVIRRNANVTIYDSALTANTLTLVSSGDAIISLYVF